MILGKVIGNVVSTRKVESLIGYKFMIVKVLDENKKETGEHLIAVDSVGAGNDDIVLVTKGSNAKYACTKTDTPVDAVIVGIVD